MPPDANCPRCGKRFERGVLRTQWLTVHPEQMLAALHEAEEAEWQGRSARVFAGTATTIVYRNLRGEKMLHCLYCPDCAIVVGARDGLIVDAPPFSRFARSGSGGHTVFASLDPRRRRDSSRLKLSEAFNESRAFDFAQGVS